MTDYQPKWQYVWVYKSQNKHKYQVVVAILIPKLNLVIHCVPSNINSLYEKVTDTIRRIL